MTTPILVCLDGFLSRHVGVNIAADLAPLNPLAVTSASGLNAWPKWLDGRIDRQVAGLESFVVAGFSAGAKAAARLAERNPHCVGLIYISGLEWSPFRGSLPAWKMLLRWRKFPALCACTIDEADALFDGTTITASKLGDAGASVTYEVAESPVDPNTGEPYKRPHLAGVAHHLPAIRAFMDQHYGGTA